MGNPHGTLEEKFWRQVEPEPMSGCWLWTGELLHDGYGRVGHQYRHLRAHRVAHELYVGPIPAGMQVCHRCDNPQCVNPRHLFLGTPTDNRHDSVRKGRHASGERHGRARLTADQAQEIRAAEGSDSAISRRYGVSHTTVWRIKRGTGWA